MPVSIVYWLHGYVCSLYAELAIFFQRSSKVSALPPKRSIIPCTINKTFQLGRHGCRLNVAYIFHYCLFREIAHLIPLQLLFAY